MPRKTTKRAHARAQIKKAARSPGNTAIAALGEIALKLGNKVMMTRPLPDDSAERKTYPIMTGFVDYFPAAVAEVAHVSYLGNQKHNPGQELHWSRGKSNDHADCAMRHLVERGTRDGAGVRHLAQAAWRVLAALQLELEADGAPVARGAIPRDILPSR